MSEIQSVKAREVLDSRGFPTVEVDVWTRSGVLGRAIVPSGASTGLHEACELRDGGDRFLGKGVEKAVHNVNGEIAQMIVGSNVLNWQKIDSQLLDLDGTANKTRLGANAILGVSLACVKAAALVSGQPLYRYLGDDKACQLPVPLMNVINGGAHADNGLDVQEFMIVPRLQNFKESLRAGSEIFHHLKKRLSELGLTTAVGDEGGFAPRLKSNQEALDNLCFAIEKAGYRLGEDVLIALDVAASELFKDSMYTWEGHKRSSQEITQIYSSWKDKYPIWSIEDGLSEDDWDGWKHMTQELGKKMQLVGDDLFVTNVQRLQRGIDEGCANALLVKVNQIGSLTETQSAVQLAHKSGFTTVMSHRSGETEDTTIADLAVALGSSQIKTGSLCRSERIAKYNQLLRIEEELGDKAQFARLDSWSS